jgi:uncharacterized protein YciI
MKKLFLLTAFLTISASGNALAQREFQTKGGDTTYTMREYFMCFLKTGPNRSHDSVEAVEIQKGHMANITALAKAGKISMAGPFGDNGEIRGILVFNTATKEEAEKLAAEDPAVKAGRLVVEIHPWWAAKGSVLK